MANERKSVALGKTNTAILNGTEDLTAWSEEELMRGQRKSKSGRWVGRKPLVVPRAVHDELVKRKLSKAHDLLRDNIVAATSVLIELATDKDVEAGVRLKAAGMILDRTLGRAPERIDIRADLDPPWLAAIQAAVVVVPHVDALEVESWEADDDDG